MVLLLILCISGALSVVLPPTCAARGSDCVRADHSALGLRGEDKSVVTVKILSPRELDTSKTPHTMVYPRVRFWKREKREKERKEEKKRKRKKEKKQGKKRAETSLLVI
jgi:hypothetical protein